MARGECHFEHSRLIRYQAKRLAFFIALDDFVDELNGADGWFRLAFYAYFQILLTLSLTCMLKSMKAMLRSQARFYKILDLRQLQVDNDTRSSRDRDWSV